MMWRLLHVAGGNVWGPTPLSLVVFTLMVVGGSLGAGCLLLLGAGR